MDFTENMRRRMLHIHCEREPREQLALHYSSAPAVDGVQSVNFLAGCHHRNHSMFVSQHHVASDINRIASLSGVSARWHAAGAHELPASGQEKSGAAQLY